MRRRLFWTVVFSCLVENQSRFSPLNDHLDNSCFADILSGALQTTRAKDALLVLRNMLLDEQADDILDKISAATTQRVPTLYVNADRTESEFQVSSSAMSRDLVAYIYVSEREPDVVERELVAEDVKRFVHDRVRPKVLVLMILRRSSRDLAAFFRAMWSRKILDAIVVEYSRSEYSDEYSTIVHRYNPFIDSHTEEPYSTNVTWFTDDFPDMQGYPFVYVFTRRPPYSDFVSTSTGQKLKGIDKMMGEILTDKMNFTGIPKVMTRPYIITVPNGSQYGILPDVAIGKYDALLITLPMYGKMAGMLCAIQYTDPLFYENWCFVVPVLFVEQDFSIGTAIRLFFMSFSIIGIFWLCSRLMKFDSSRWHCLKIMGIILAMSFPSAPTKLYERIIFLSVLIVYACYSSILFVELTSIHLENNHHVQFDHIQDLTSSDLVMMMPESLLDIVIKYNDVFEYHVRRSGKKIATYNFTEICVKDLLMHQNISCFMEEGWAKLVGVNNMRNGESIIKTTKLCYLSPPAGNIFPEGSPYVRRVSDIFRMLAEGGIRDKLHRDYLQNETKETTIQMNQNQATFMYVSGLHSMIYVLITGYSISAFIFIGELIWKYFDIDLNL